VKQIGRVVHFFREAESTNDIAKSLARKSREGTVVVAETQTRGKGGLGRNWHSPRGGLWISIILKPSLPPAQTPVLNLVVSLAVAEAISMLGIEAKTRWPNDVIVRGKKIAGILAEAEFNGRTNYVVVGCGIDTNVEIESFPEDIRQRASSLRRELGMEIDHPGLMKQIFTSIEFYYRQLMDGYLREVLERWKAQSDMIGRRVQIRTRNESFAGISLDIESDGSLLVRTQDGQVQRAFVGECTLVE